MTTTKKLNREEVLAKFVEASGLDIRKLAKGIRVRTDDHEGNRFAPERYCYKITYTLFNRKKRVAFWPNTVGSQGY